MTPTGQTVCANCGQVIAQGATIKRDANGHWRHAEKCGPDLIGMKVRRRVNRETVQQ
jgi:hypothetical protein